MAKIVVHNHLPKKRAKDVSGVPSKADYEKYDKAMYDSYQANLKKFSSTAKAAEATAHEFAISVSDVVNLVKSYR